MKKATIRVNKSMLNKLLQENALGERYFKLQEDLLLYLDDLKLAFYYTFLIRESLFHEKLQEEENPWFYLKKNLLLPSTFNTKQTRAMLSRKLERLGLIKTKMEGVNLGRRKFYKIDIDGFLKLREVIHEQGGVVPKPNHRGSETELDKQYNLVNNNLLPKGNKKFGKQTSVDKANASTNEQLHNQTSLRIRRPSLELDIVKHWSAKGKPFAKVRKPETITPILKDIINESKGLPEYQYADIALSIAKTIDRAYEYLTHNYFLFKPKSVGMKQFFTPISAFQHKLHETLATCPYLNGKTKTWYNLFMHASNTWLDQNMLRQVNIPNADFAECLCERLKLDYTNLTLREKVTLKKATSLAIKFMEQNKLEWNFFSLLEDYIRYTSQPVKLYYLASKSWWNYNFGDFLLDGNHIYQLDVLL